MVGKVHLILEIDPPVFLRLNVVTLWRQLGKWVGGTVDGSEGVDGVDIATWTSAPAILLIIQLVIVGISPDNQVVSKGPHVY